MNARPRWHETECVACFCIGCGVGLLSGARTLTAFIAGLAMAVLGYGMMFAAAKRRGAA